MPRHILSPQETQILIGLSNQLTIRQIGDRLQISRATIFRKLQNARLSLGLSVDSKNVDLLREARKLGYYKPTMRLLDNGIIAVNAAEVAGAMFTGARREIT